MFITHLRRTELVALLPPARAVAEIGVYRGTYSRQILDLARPEVLHLIDPWSTERGCLSNDGHQMPAAYEEVTTNLKHEIDSGRVVLHREYSTEAAPKFADRSLDWIYVDAMHDYENVLADLRAFALKVKPDGFILGHDFSNHAAARRYGFGVIRAVREFTAEGGFEIVLMTTETHPTYLLARVGNDTTLPRLQAALFNHRVHRRSLPVSVDAGLLDRFEQVELVLEDGRRSQMIRFG
jgi:hypothetical protein